MFGPLPGSSFGLLAVVHAAVADVVDPATASDEASSRLSMVITGLIVLAVLIAISTVVFWRATKPDRSANRELGIRWIQPEEGQAATWAGAAPPVATESGTPPSAPASPAAPTPVADGAGPEFGSLRPAPADG